MLLQCLQNTRVYFILVNFFTFFRGLFLERTTSLNTIAQLASWVAPPAKGVDVFYSLGSNSILGGATPYVPLFPHADILYVQRTDRA
jgi:hypothetical protein